MVKFENPLLKIPIVAKYRKEAYDDYFGDWRAEPTWRRAILEAIFKPKLTEIPGGKNNMTHLHPDMDKLHFPEHVYIADWRKYKVEDHPALVNFQKRCHAAGLHDPWLRNYAFNFYPNHMSFRSKTAFMTQGLFFGLVAGGLIFYGEKIYDHYYPMTYAHTPEYIEKYGTGERHHH